jgi:acyl-CoA dehydrogenase
MDFDIPEEARMLAELVEKFVADELMPLEPAVLEREASGARTMRVYEGPTEVHKWDIARRILKNRR